MKTRQVTVGNTLGLHARLAAQVVHVASKFKCSVSLAFKGRTADARNVIAVMLLAASVGGTILIEANGPDEAEALDTLTSLLGDRADR
ncbi:MAG TPA: HPr family phosphocarrier protein [Burkholderiales bacterium]|jgi:phosphocarrier protein|nr:HPr family phosphocarrier protein [Burkholderiales bacterium]